jgi:hypothetical protein
MPKKQRSQNGQRQLDPNLGVRRGGRRGGTVLHPGTNLLPEEVHFPLAQSPFDDVQRHFQRQNSEIEMVDLLADSFRPVLPQIGEPDR